MMYVSLAKTAQQKAVQEHAKNCKCLRKDPF
jgi:hypothetical protein